MKFKNHLSGKSFKLHIAALLLSVNPLTCVLCQQIIYIDDSNTSGIENGTIEFPYNTIEEGIAVSAGGDTIMVKTGTYYPDSVWQEYTNALYLKPGISIIGEGRENTVIEGILVDWDPGNLSCTLEKIGFQKYFFNRGTSGGPFLKPHIIRNCQAEFINISHSAGIPLNDTTPGANHGFIITHNDLGEGGIRFAQGSGVSDISVQKNTCGTVMIYSGAGYTYHVDDNDIKFGIIDASGACHTTISHNRIYDGCIIDKSAGSQYIIEDQLIEHNTINCNENSPLFQEKDYKAAIIARPRSVTIRNNTITCTGAVYGIYSKSGAPFHVIDNNIQIAEAFQPALEPDEAVCGIYTKAGWGYVTGNTIHGGQIGYYSNAGTEYFSENKISGSYFGFFSSGAEEVHHNTIKNCHGDGMVMNGLRGPVHNNVVKDNAGSGIRIVRPEIDLGGGNFGGPGNNTITGNGNFDLYVDGNTTQYAMIYAKYNVWDHSDSADIHSQDIYIPPDLQSFITVTISPVGSSGQPDNSDPESVLLYPNPTPSKFRVQALKVSDGIQRIEITDLYGKTPDTPMIAQKLPASSIECDISGLPSGAYFIRISIENQWYVKRIMKL